jgi:RimJ/RimL family protein N-acetyltransferase
MQPWPVTLENAFVRLRPFEPDTDGPEVHALAARAPEIFRFWSYRGAEGWVRSWIEAIRERTEEGSMIAFAVTRAGDGAFVGITSYLDPSPANRSVEVGMTCYAPEVQGTAVNPAAKRLLLAHAFEEQAAVRVQFSVDTRNQRSQAAVLKLGAKREGILRQNKIVADGYLRDTAVFSILDKEWPELRARLDARLADEPMPSG